MTRALIAWVPVRGTFWSGLSGGCVTHWCMNRTFTSTLAVRTRVSLDGDAWLPGDPSDTPPTMTNRAPSLDDGVAAKDAADVFVESAAGFLRRTITARFGKTRIEDLLAPDFGWCAPPFSRDGGALDLDTDVEALQLAPAHRRAAMFGENTALGWEVDRLGGPSGSLGFVVGALVFFQDKAPILVEMLCDSVYIDLVQQQMELVWRGIYLDDSWGVDVERILVGVLPPGLDEENQVRLLEEGLAHAVFTWSAINEDIENQSAPPPLDEDEQAMARLSSWDEGPGACVLGADEFAKISAELSTGKKREEVLAAHGFDEIAWSREEWAHSERIANESAEMPDNLGDEESTDNLQIKPIRAPTTPKKIDLAEYARLSAHLEVRNPARVLAEAHLSVAEFVAIEQSMSEALDADPDLAQEFERLVPTHNEEAQRAHATDLEQFDDDDDEDEPSTSTTENQ